MLAHVHDPARELRRKHLDRLQVVALQAEELARRQRHRRGRVLRDRSGVFGVEYEEVDEHAEGAANEDGEECEAGEALVKAVADAEDDGVGLEEEVDDPVYELEAFDVSQKKE